MSRAVLAMVSLTGALFTGCEPGRAGAPVDGGADSCAADACVHADLVIGGATRSQRVTPCANLVHRLYNKALNRTSSCAVTLAACGASSVSAIDDALAHPDVVAALTATSSVFVDPSREGPAFEVLVGRGPWDGYFHPREDGHHAIVVQTSCAPPGCPSAPPGVVSLARVLEGLASLCDPLASPDAAAPP
jgi:hypothetical protein